MSDPDMGNWSYTYDALNNLKTQTDARACVLTMNYDLLNRMTSKASSGTGCGTQTSATYAYDAGTNGLGRCTSASSGTITNSWTYDARRRVASETAMGYTTSYTYNFADMPKSMTYPDGEIVNYAYNARMLPTTLNGTSFYVTNAMYDSAGRLTSRSLGNGLTQNYAYYAWNIAVQGGHLQSIQTGVIQNLAYTYDPAGNITQIANGVALEAQTYTYDAINRLTGWTLNTQPTESYAYDSSTGNLMTKGATTLQYNNASHPHAVSNAGSNTYAYDANGNQVTRVIASGSLAGTYNLSYDTENRLVRVKKNNSTIATYTYDADGRQVKSAVNRPGGRTLTPAHQLPAPKR